MDYSKDQDRLIKELETLAQSGNDGRKTRQIMAVIVCGLTMLLTPPLFPLLWMAAVQIASIMDARISKIIGSIRNNNFPLRLAYLLVLLSIAFSATIFSVFSPVVWQIGGDGGKLLAALMLSAALVHISLYLSQFRLVYFVSALPFFAAFAFLPLYARFVSHSLSTGGMFAVFGGLALFILSVAKASGWVKSLFNENKRAKEKTESVNAQLSAMTRALNQHAMVSISDQDGLLYEVNDLFCEMSQYSREELIGKNIRLLDTGHHDAAFFETLQKTINAGQVWNGQIQNKAKDGSTYWADVTISPVTDYDGKITSCVSIRRDITKLQNAIEDAERANQAKSEFLAMMSHELRTPMNAVLGMASLLKASKLDDQQREYITALTDGGEMLMTVLNDILDLSKIEAGKLEMETIDVDVRHAVKRLERLWAPNAEDKGLKFTCTIDDNVPSVIRGDITRIRQIIYNLLSNAVKFTEEGEVSLSVSAEASDGNSSRLAFSVKDTGVGITEEAQSRLFTSFEQADKSVTRKFGGTGLGLAISKKLAQLMGGDINICSKPGEGACFTFSLEAKVITHETLKAKTEAAPKAKTKKNSQSKAPLRILAAEDNALNQRVLKAFLQPLNYDVVFANDGVEAMEYLGTQAFDVILMDVQMPRKDGLTTTRELRASNGPNAEAPIIAMTANAMSGDRQKCIDVGMTDYVPKPIDPRVLLTAIARASTQKKSKDEQAKTASAHA